MPSVALVVRLMISYISRSPFVSGFLPVTIQYHILPGLSTTFFSFRRNFFRDGSALANPSFGALPSLEGFHQYHQGLGHLIDSKPSVSQFINSVLHSLVPPSFDDISIYDKAKKVNRINEKSELFYINVNVAGPVRYFSMLKSRIKRKRAFALLLSTRTEPACRCGV